MVSCSLVGARVGLLYLRKDVVLWLLSGFHYRGVYQEAVFVTTDDENVRAKYSSAVLWQRAVPRGTPPGGGALPILEGPGNGGGALKIALSAPRACSERV